eukprot:TRINITY_DN1232_c0_g6_i1.p1 TRINITY_DN1232_c0_g6~~TRINITY_DN1232_c0_g6_i1.p1  ORF type:complete len:177 (+),score=71.00 TRINITY_DN1232_c0_g6_i1:648-1178(+)
MNIIEEQKRELERLAIALHDRAQENSQLMLVEEELKQQLANFERQVYTLTQDRKEKEISLQTQLQSALNDINSGVRQKREMAELELKYKMTISEKAKLEEQIENLIASKQLVQQTMAGQLMTMKAQLDDVAEEKSVLMEEYRRVVSSNEELQNKYRSEQLKAKTLFDELRLSKLKS